MKFKRPADHPKKTSAGRSLAPRLAAYSATATAALAFAPHAHAQVVLITSFDYSSQTNTTTPPSFALPYPRAGLNFTAGPFQFGFSGVEVYHNSSGGGGQADIGGNISFAIGLEANALKLGLGSAIKPQTAFNAGFAEVAFHNTINPSVPDAFNPSPNGAVTGYIGFKGSNAGHNYYGWLNVKVTADSNAYPTSISLVAKDGDPGVFGAYVLSTTPGADTFGAGDTSVIAVPEPADAAFGLGLLAFGAAGVRELRRRRKQAA